MGLPQAKDDLKATREALRAAYVFSALEDNFLDQLAQGAEWVKVKPTDTILQRGQRNEHLFVLMSGTLLVEQELRAGTDIVIARITPGNVVGELSYVDRQVTSATIRAENECELLRIKHLDIERIFSQDPRIEVRFMKEIVLTLSERLRNTNKDLVNALQYLT